MQTLIFYLNYLEYVLILVGWYYTFRGREWVAFLWYAVAFTSMGFRNDMEGHPYFWVWYAIAALSLFIAFVASRKR